MDNDVCFNHRQTAAKMVERRPKGSLQAPFDKLRVTASRSDIDQIVIVPPIGTGNYGPLNLGSGTVTLSLARPELVEGSKGARRDPR